MSRYNPYGGGQERTLDSTVPTGHAGYNGAHHQLSSMSFNESSAYHHYQVGRISQSVFDQGILSPMQVTGHQNGAPQEFRAHGKAEAPAHPHKHHRHPHQHPHQHQHYGRSPGESAESSSAKHNSNPDTSYDKSYDGAKYAAGDAKANAKVVADVAKKMGVDPATAIAAMLVESGGNAHAIGDHGTSFGLFQLHRGGELGKMSPNQAYDPETNAKVALSYFKKGEQQNPGAMAAAAQRPADRAGYARKVNARMAQARQLLHEVENS
jgi:hypothetical protein